MGPLSLSIIFDTLNIPTDEILEIRIVKNEVWARLFDCWNTSWRYLLWYIRPRVMRLLHRIRSERNRQSCRRLACRAGTLHAPLKVMRFSFVSIVAAREPFTPGIYKFCDKSRSLCFLVRVSVGKKMEDNDGSSGPDQKGKGKAKKKDSGAGASGGYRCMVMHCPWFTYARVYAGGLGEKQWPDLPSQSVYGKSAHTFVDFIPPKINTWRKCEIKHCYRKHFETSSLLIIIHDIIYIYEAKKYTHSH